MDKLLTLEEYLEQRYDLTDEGRWHDLVAGKLVDREQPSDAQGLAILNLTRLLGNYFLQTAAEQPAYACFELGLVLSREPDSVRFPAISVYRDGNRFEHLDELTTDQLPLLAIDHARNPTANSELAREYLRNGIQAVWLIDCQAKSLEVYHGSEEIELELHQIEYAPESELPGLRIAIAELFPEPDA
ncbi:MAG: Uma2 family endonuclease [Planctomycetaceae bacterium]|nr:Uma2 family endonuclease [Planctomycetaceae bacterium]